ncbi:MAG: hypothetical protein P0S96_08605 [Simkaniaceae bacterium]|nr:hypothetical protein [Candidatus Sacchlamyda saccharinae]
MIKKYKAYLVHHYSLVAYGLIPCLLALFGHLSSEKKLSQQIDEALYLKEKENLADKKAKLQEALNAQMKSASADYLETVIEPMQFLRSETQKISAMLHGSPENKAYQTRLQFLQNGQNTLRFRQQNFQRIGNQQEMEAKQIHPVELSREDLKQLLANIENITLGDTKPEGNPPNLLIKNFELIKKPLPTSEEVFLVNLELIKREIIHE